MATVSPPPPPRRPFLVPPAPTGVTLRVDFATGRILGPIDPADAPAGPNRPAR